jgi:microcystin-dependent protein
MAGYVSSPVSLESMDFPVGTILMYPWTTSLPKGWLLCDGSGFATASYPALYSAIGLTYGSSGGFQVPNMTSRVPVGSGGESPGATGGATEVALTAEQTGMVAHRHRTLDASNSGSTQCDSGSNDEASFNNINYGGTTGGAVKDGSAAPINGSTHTNLQPYMSMYFIIKAFA